MNLVIECRIWIYSINNMALDFAPVKLYDLFYPVKSIGDYPEKSYWLTYNNGLTLEYHLVDHHTTSKDNIKARFKVKRLKWFKTNST